jgi:CMP-N-acetylneuraminic acid synthetase
MKNQIPKITVYMPNYNYGQYIEEAIQSVQNQVFKDWELIIIDDGSTDNSDEVLERYSTDEKITIIKQKNKGLNITNNVAIRLSRGKYIVRLDADDYLDENFLTVLSSILDDKKNIGLVFPDYHHVDPKGLIIETIRREKISDSNSLLDLPAHGACTMYRKEVLLNLGSYDEEFSCQDGYDIWIRFIEKYKPYNINVPLFYYRQHDSNLTKSSERILDTRSAIKRKFVESRSELHLNVLGILMVHQSSIYKQNGPFVKIDNKNLIDYALEQAVLSEFLSDIVVSSDDIDVREYIDNSYPDVMNIERSNEVSDFNANTVDIAQDAIKKVESKTNKKYDAICLLSISTPLLKSKHIDHAINTLQVFGVDSVRSISEEFSPCYRHESDGLIGINIFDGKLPRLERNAIYKDNGAILLTKRHCIEDRTLTGEKVSHITMLPEESIKVNSDFEFWLAEKIITDWRKR